MSRLSKGGGNTIIVTISNIIRTVHPLKKYQLALSRLIYNKQTKKKKAILCQDGYFSHDPVNPDQELCFLFFFFIAKDNPII